MSSRRILPVITVLLLALACKAAFPATPTQACRAIAVFATPATATRSFRMGFTTWPPEASLEGLKLMYRFLRGHSDLTVLHMDGGVPWPEALSGEDFPAGLTAEWEREKTNLTPDHALFVAITPLDLTRSKLAPYRGNEANQPLPAPWDGYPVNHADVQQAYLNYARRVVDYFHPDYLSIGIEVNVALNTSREAWNAYLELHVHTYEQLKVEYPDLPVFASVTLSHLTGLDGGDAAVQQREVAALMEHSDLLALSAYPYGWAFPSGKLDPLPEDYFDAALGFGKPVAIAETGAPSEGFQAYGRTYDFSDAYQSRYIELLLRKALEHRFVFVVNWASTDYDRLLEIFPDDTRELATFWVHTGLQRGDGCPKPALAIWDSYLQSSYSPPGD